MRERERGNHQSFTILLTYQSAIIIIITIILQHTPAWQILTEIILHDCRQHCPIPARDPDIVQPPGGNILNGRWFISLHPSKSHSLIRILLSAQILPDSDRTLAGVDEMKVECAVLVEGLSVNSASFVEINQRRFGLGEGRRVESNGLPLLPGSLHLKANASIK